MKPSILNQNNQQFLKVENLQSIFQTRTGMIKAVDGLSFTLEKGDILGIVGESGSGKSVSMLSLLGLLPKPLGKVIEGSAYFKGENLLSLNQKDLRRIRGNRIAMIFQDPMSSLNPYLKISTQLTEVLYEHRKDLSKKQALEKAIKALEKVGIPEAAKRIHHYPHQFSGGMRQRVMIAMGLISDPDLLIADEPTTALDVTIQAQILDLLSRLQKEQNLSIILITHDLGVIAGLCNKVLVMYAGKPVEYGLIKDIFYNPKHPYTKGLLNSKPTEQDNFSDKRLSSIPGQPPDLAHLQPGCSFAPRCSLAKDICQNPSGAPKKQVNASHYFNCHQESAYD